MVFLFREMTLEYLSLNKMTPINSIVESCSILELNSMYFHSILSVQSNNFFEYHKWMVIFLLFCLEFTTATLQCTEPVNKEMWYSYN